MKPLMICISSFLLALCYAQPPENGGARNARPQAGERTQAGERGQGGERAQGESEGRRGPGAQGGGQRMMPPIMVALDKNKDGEIDAEELEAASASLKTLDKNEDGKLTREEIRPPFGRSGEGAPGAGRGPGGSGEGGQEARRGERPGGPGGEGRGAAGGGERPSRPPVE